MRILLVKLSSLGDVVHTLPVVEDIRAALPNATIDWVVERGFAPVLALSAGLSRVIPCEIRRWRRAPFTAQTRAEWARFKAELQSERYDAVIDLQGLTKSAVVARMARLAPGGKRFALGNRTEGSGYEAPTRWLADVHVTLEPHVHAVQRGRQLCAQALGFALQPQVRYGLNPQRSEAGTGVPPTVLFVHGTSRADKEWPLAHWIALGRRLLDSGAAIALAHGSDAELATSRSIAEGMHGGRSASALNPAGEAPDVNIWPKLPLDRLTQCMAACDGVVGVDSGLSHIAVALDLPHVQIYNFDTSWRTGPLLREDTASAAVAAPRQVAVFARPTPDVDAVWKAWRACVSGVGQPATAAL